MWSEFDENGQMQLDCRLSSERNMEENTMVMIEFATDIRKEQVGDAKVKSRHEGYGLLADMHQTVGAKMKLVNDGMKSLLMSLAQNDQIAIENVERVASALADTILAATEMAAEAKRVSLDLWNGYTPPKTPLEEYVDGFEEPAESAEEDKEEEENGED